MCVQVTGMSQNMQLLAKMWCHMWQLKPVKRNMVTWVVETCNYSAFMGENAAAKYVQRLWNPRRRWTHHTRATGKTTLCGNGACMRVCFKGEKELSPEIWVTEQEIHQGEAEVGKVIPLLSEKWMAWPPAPPAPPTHAHTCTLAAFDSSSIFDPQTCNKSE